MKILLIQPPFTVRKFDDRRCQPPLGLAYLASFLKNEHDILILDSIVEGFDNVLKINEEFVRYGLPYSEIKRRLESFSPDVVGVSCLFTTQSENAHSICKLAKETNRNIITVLGGAHPSALPQEELKDQNVDFVIIGEGEYCFRDLLREIEGKGNFSSIEGMAFRENGAVKINPKRNFITNLDSLPFPAWDLLPFEKYSKINRPHGTQTKQAPFAPILTSRGCPNSCVFCSVHNIWGRNFRKRSVENVLSEIKYLINTFGIREIHFEDDNLTLDKKRATQIFKNLKERKYNLSWSTPNGIFIDTVDKEMLGVMKESGCYSVSFAIESGDKYVLANLIGKRLDLDRVPEVIRHSRSLGLETTAFFVIGFPGEKIKQLSNTFRFARSIKADNVNFFFATALPGTELWKQVRHKGLLPRNFNYADLRADRPTISPNGLSKEQLVAMATKEKLISYIYLLFLNPAKFFRKSSSKLKKCWQMALQFIAR